MKRFFAALKDRRMPAMALIAFAAGLPYGAVLGLLNAWLTELGVTPASIGTLSLVTLGYAFKYLWAPAFQTARAFPGLSKLGARRSWLLALQLTMSALLCVFAFVDPVENIGLIALIALVISLVSPTHDLILDAWRIEVARTDQDKDLMSALYQFGYKSAGFVTGFAALLLADHFGWSFVFLLVAVFLALSVSGTLLAPEPDAPHVDAPKRASFLPSLPRRIALPALLIVATGWAVAFGMIFVFVAQALFFQTGASGSGFVRQQGPWIIGLTVLLPAIVCAVMVFRFGAKPIEGPVGGSGQMTRDPPSLRPPSPLEALFGSLFRAIFDPMMELVARLRWGAILVLSLALTYRFTDAVWGSFAYPFYLGDDFGAIGHTLADVAIASKFFGVIATILGSLLGAILIGLVGRMPVFFVGGIVAAVTNLLYADLAAGAVVLDAFLRVSQLGPPLSALADWASGLSTEAYSPGDGQRMARLMVTIFAENIAGGFALVAMTAYLTSVVNPRFAAVQYALLASLTMLIGTLGRPWLGEIIEAQGYYTVFIGTFWLGGVAVVLSVLEWIRLSRERASAREVEHAAQAQPVSEPYEIR
jgi:MFS transporter, PAT family, beta-lactamase induction signal transducer AmpG